jgi:predicted transcriptional regulator
MKVFATEPCFSPFTSFLSFFTLFSGSFPLEKVSYLGLILYWKRLVLDKSTDKVYTSYIQASEGIGMLKQAVFTMKLEPNLRDEFMAAAEETHRPASQLVRDFMRNFVQEQRQLQEHDAWFQNQVQASIDDKSQSIPHEQVITEMKSRMDARLKKEGKL